VAHRDKNAACWAVRTRWRVLQDKRRREECRSSAARCEPAYARCCAGADDNEGAGCGTL